MVKGVLLTTFFQKHIGGLQTHFDLLARALGKKVKVDVLQRDIGFYINLKKFFYWLKCGFNKDSARINFLRDEITLFSRKLYEKLIYNRYDLIHCHDAFAAYVCKDFDIPVVLTVHGPLHFEYKMYGVKEGLSFLFYLELEAYKRANCIITVDSGLKNYIVSNFNIDPRKVVIVRNAVDLEEIDFWAKQEPKINLDFEYVLVPRRLVPKNGVLVAVEAMKFLKDYPFKLVIAGDGPQKIQILRAVKENALDSKVVLLGSVERTKLLMVYRLAFAIVIPSIPVEGVVEATSLSALEAMAMGKVVIASNIGGLSEIICNGDDGFLFEAGNAEMLANILSNVFINSKVRELVGQKARHKVILNYSLDKWSEEIIRIYNNLLT